MSEFLLIAGSCHGAWCWYRVIAALEGLGHKARAIDLPAHGDDKTPAADATLTGYAEAILAAIDRPLVLVGHSAAGFPISLAADRAPEKIRALVYVAAYIPKVGQSLVQMRRAGPRQPLAGAFELTEDHSSYCFDPAQLNALFYHDCLPEDQLLAAAMLCPEPLAPQMTPILLGDGLSSVARYHIRATEDRAIPPEYQAQMAQDLPPEHRLSLPTSHSPFFSDPDALAHHLSAIAAAQR